jgi:hypothetical protein
MRRDAMRVMAFNVEELQVTEELLGAPPRTYVCGCDGVPLAEKATVYLKLGGVGNLSPEHILSGFGNPQPDRPTLPYGSGARICLKPAILRQMEPENRLQAS